MTYQTEFPDFSPDDMPSIPPSWSDISWHNDACPSFLITDALGLYVDFADPLKSDFPECRASGDLKRFQLFPMVDGMHPLANDEPVAYSDDWDETLAEAIAYLFAEGLREIASADEWETMRQSNVGYGEGICASHDFCDANMVMQPAFESVMGRDILDFPDGEEMSEADCALWGRAWDIAKRRYLTAA